MDLTQLLPITELTQGDYWNFNVSIPEYDATLTTCSYYFKNALSVPFHISSVPATDGTFQFTVSSATTATYLPGNYSLIIVMVDNATSERTTVANTYFTIAPDLTLSSVSDPRSAYRIALDQVEAALASSVASGDAGLMEYTIGGTTIKTDKQGLLNLRSFYLQRVRTEEGKRAIGNILYNL